MTAPVDATAFTSPALRALAERGFIEQMSDGEAIDEALGKGPVAFYIGYDPTAVSLHIGNLTCIMAMRVLQRFGHKPIVLLGGGTARIGDPSGRSETRKMMDEATIDAHVKGIGAVFGRFLDMSSGPGNGTIIVDNAQWLLDWKYIDFLREVGVHFTVNRMIATKTYRDRLTNEQPLTFLEFNYQLLQAYDFLHLYRKYDCTFQLGGSDQWGNMVAGVELIRRVSRRDLGPAQCLTFPLLTTADGRKMGKTQRGAVWLEADLVSAYDYYQWWLSCADRDVRRLLLVFTDLPVGEIDELCKADGAALRDVKARLAFEATTMCHGAEEAQRARTAAHQVFGGSDDWSAVPAVELGVAEIKLLDLVVDDRLRAFASKRQARQRIENGAVKIDGDVCKDATRTLKAHEFDDGTLRLQAGKKCRFRVILGATGQAIVTT